MRVRGNDWKGKSAVLTVDWLKGRIREENEVMRESYGEKRWGEGEFSRGIKNEEVRIGGQ